MYWPRHPANALQIAAGKPKPDLILLEPTEGEERGFEPAPKITLPRPIGWLLFWHAYAPIHPQLKCVHDWLADQNICIR